MSAQLSDAGRAGVAAFSLVATVAIAALMIATLALVRTRSRA